MNCIEAQSYIMPFIDGKVPDNKQEEFVMHMKTCKKCHEELEIYYTLIVGMKQLDENKALSSDFAKDVEFELDKLNAKVKGRRRAKLSTFSIAFAVVISLFILYYGQVLNKVYQFEQKTKLEQQGTFYFYNELKDKVLLENEDRLVVIEEQDRSVFDFYKKVRVTKYSKETIEKLTKIGEVIFDE